MAADVRTSDREKGLQCLVRVCQQSSQIKSVQEEKKKSHRVDVRMVKDWAPEWRQGTRSALIRSRGAKPIFTIMRMSNTNATTLTISFSGCGGLKLNQDICLPVFKVPGACNQRIAKGPRDGCRNRNSMAKFQSYKLDKETTL
jgi:hypothetical protein